MLYGREPEAAVVVGLLDGARRSRSGVLVVRGEPGIGKSALLEAARAGAGDMGILSAQGIESEAPLPFAGLHQLLRPALGRVGRLPGPQAAALRGALGLEAGVQADPFLVSLAVLSLLAEVAERRPLLCLVDDAHWIDDASADALVFVARRLEAESVVLLFAAREGERRRFEAPGLPALRLGGLGAEAVAVLRARRSRLGAAAAAMDAAERAGLVEVRGAHLAFRHPLVRSAVYQGAPLSRRQAAHLALAATLAGEPDADRRAWHRAAAAVEPDASVAGELEEAAWRARRRSGYGPASLALERSATLSPDPSERARLLTGAAECAWFAGRVDRVAMMLERARPLAGEPARRADIDRLRGLVEMTRGVPAEAGRELLRAATEVEPLDPERALQLLNLASVAAAYAGDGTADIAVAEAVRGLSPRKSLAGRTLTPLLIGIGAYAEASLRAHRDTTARARASGALGVLAHVLPRLTQAEISAGRWPSAAANAREGLRLGREIGQDHLVAQQLVLLAVLAALQGDEEECRSLAAEGRDLAAARGLGIVADVAHHALTLLELALGRPEEALAHGRQIRTRIAGFWAALDRVEAATRAGEREPARGWLESLASWAESVGALWARGRPARPGAPQRRHRRERAPPGRGERGLCEGVAALRACAGRACPRGVPPEAAAADGRPCAPACGPRRLRDARRRDLGGAGAARASRERSDGPPWQPALPGRAHSPRAAGGPLRRRGSPNRQVAAQLFLSPRTVEFHLRNVFRKLGIATRTELARMDLDDLGHDPIGRGLVIPTV